MMKKVLPLLLVIVLFFLAPTGIFAQNNIFSGTVYDQDGVQPLPYAEINCPCMSEPVMTDVNGNFEIIVRTDECVFTISYALFKDEVVEVSFSPKNRKVMKKIKMKPDAEELTGVTIEGEKLDHDPGTATTSITIMSPDDAGVIDPTNAGELVDKMPGVAVVDNEPQIRGGSGFSSGMGSRVLILLDDIPLLRPDAGRPMWSFIPMEDVKNIEIYKGASSVLYGSSALTGAINVLTAYPGLKPKTHITLHGGVYDNPKYGYKKSWGKVPPMLWGVSFLHSRIIAKHWDLVIGGEYFHDQSYIGPEYAIDSIPTKNDAGKYEMRARLNFNLRYRAQKVKNLAASLSGNFMYSENAQSFFWYDSDTNMYRTYKGSLSLFKEFMFYVDPCASYISPDGSHHDLRNRITFSDNQEATGAQSARSLMVYDEYQFTKMIKRIGLGVTAGIVNNYTQSLGCVFNGEQGSLAPGLMTMDNLSVYAQLEKKFFKNQNLSLVVGARWEAFWADTCNRTAHINDSLPIGRQFAQKPIFRAGISYQIPASMTSFRASFGQGFRYPTIGERYISISVGNYGFYPNPKLVPETSWNVEFGIAQPYRVGPFEGMFDAAAYHQEFKNFIEFAFGGWGTTGTFLNDMGFMYLNTGPASITGVDVSLVGKGEIGKNVEMTFLMGYTYSYPITKNDTAGYYVNPTNNITYSYVTTASDPSKNILKYRIQHNAKLNVGFLFWKKLGFEIGCTYYSAMKNVDNLFFSMDSRNEEMSQAARNMLAGLGTLPFTGYANYFNTHKKGSFTLDLCLSYQIIEQLEISFSVKNVLNNQYTLRPMYLEAPRNYNLKIVVSL